MYRSYKKMDRIHVYQSDPMGKRLDIFEQQPYSHAGFDNYEYRGVMYPGFVYTKNPEVVYILLDKPLFPKG